MKDRLVCQAEVEVVLTEDEINARRQSAIEIISDKIPKLKCEKKSYTASLNEKIKWCEWEVSRLAKIIETGKETRKMECFWAYDVDTDKMQLHRSDNYEVVRIRDLTEDERQLHLPFARDLVEPPTQEEVERVKKPKKKKTENQESHVEESGAAPVESGHIDG